MTLKERYYDIINYISKFDYIIPFEFDFARRRKKILKYKRV